MSYLKSNIDYLLKKNKTNPNDLEQKHPQIKQSTLFRIQNGITKDPRRSTLEPFAKWAGVTVSQLIETDLSQVPADETAQSKVSLAKDKDVEFAPVRFREADIPVNPNHVRIPIYKNIKAACGAGIENFLEDISDYLQVDPLFLKMMGVESNPQNLRIIYAAEYSMYPTVAPNSPLFVDISDKDPSTLKSGNVYVFMHNYELRMKRIFVSYGSNTVRLASDNPDKNRYPDEFITNEQLNEINFVGRLELALVKP
ncbi:MULTISPECIES: S24 family peptidase [Acinetobacter]|uniref:LexA family transcriptional regulator n=1 Tax=Acinetobacter piscicola TaxID=2006115 RepID=A0A7S6VW58_9GAMM|nr:MULTISPECIES: S24 family peptidase [Acinetobacter]QOW46028.1 LexA family transcriptional regulator [Acinetobacter piscicola]